MNPHPLFSVRANITCLFPSEASTGSRLEMTTFEKRHAWFGASATQGPVMSGCPHVTYETAGRIVTKFGFEQLRETSGNICDFH